MNKFTENHLKAYILRTMVDPFDPKEIQFNFVDAFAALIASWLDRMTESDAQYLIDQGWPYLIEEYNKKASVI